MAVQVREQGSHHRFQVKLRVTGTGVTALLVLQFPSLRISLRVTVGTVSSAQPWSSDPESTAARPGCLLIALSPPQPPAAKDSHA